MKTYKETMMLEESFKKCWKKDNPSFPRIIGISLIALFILIIIMEIMPLVRAELPPVKSGDCVNIKIPYNATWINISTITYPNQTMISLGILANKSGGTFFYNDFCDTYLIGTYSYEFCVNDGFCSGNTFEVSNNGDIMNTSQALIYIIILIINLSALSVFLYLSIKLEYRNEEKETKNGTIILKVTKSKYAKLLCIWITSGIFLWFTAILTGMVNNYINFQPLKDMTTNLYIFSSIIAGYGMSITMIWLLFYNVWKDILLNKTILREGMAVMDPK